MALIAHVVLKLMKRSRYKLVPQLAGGILAEVFMVVGYFVFEGFLYGFAPSLVNIPTNCVQGIAGIVIGVVLIKAFEKTGIGLD